MKKSYETPNALMMLICSADIMTQSLNFSNDENAEINENDVHSFESFF